MGAKRDASASRSRKPKHRPAEHAALCHLGDTGQYRILGKEDLADCVHLFRIDAPAIAAKAQAGQFVVICIDDRGERIPLTLADWDSAQGEITLVFMEVGASTRQLATLGVGDSIKHIAGPLGRPTRVEKFGTVVCVGGGVGVAPIAPVARALKQAGNRIISIMGARSQSLLFWEDRFRRWSDELIVTTDDGSYARKGVVTQPLREILESGQKIDLVIAIGPAIMMKFCAKTTEPFGVKTIASLNPIMVDGTGMCGCCRVSVGGVTKFGCVDGPEFDAHQVNWDELFARQAAYKEKERVALEAAIASGLVAPM